MSGEKFYTCCICGQLFFGWGNNPWPVVQDENAVCCDACNFGVVIPARLNDLAKKKQEATDDGTR